MFKVMLAVVISFVSINALAGEAENISACVNKSKEFSGVVLNEFNVKYEGNVLARSVAKWDNATCEIKFGKVYTLEVNGIVYIYEGFAGKDSYNLNSNLQTKTDEVVKLLNSRIALLQQRASQVSVSLTKPKPDHQYLTHYINQGIEQSLGKSSTNAATKNTSDSKIANTATAKPTDSTKVLALNEPEVFIPRSIAGDQGKYYLISSKKESGVITALHKRVGLDSIGYTKTEINCTNMTYRVMGYSEISANAIQAHLGDWSDLVQGSSKSDLVNFVCQQ